MATEGSSKDYDLIWNKKVCCLYRIGQAIKNHEVVILDGKATLTVGRSEDNDLHFAESLAVSRRHCVLEKTGAEWSITDLSSSNGIYVNHRRLAPRQAHVLQDRDMVEIGKDPTGQQPVAYTFQYFKKAKLEKSQDRKGTKRTVTGLSKADTITAQSPSTLVKAKIAEHEKILRKEMEEKQKEAEERIRKMEELLVEKENALKINQVELQQKSHAMDEARKLADAEQAELAAKLQQEREEVERKLREEEEGLQQKLVAMEEAKKLAEAEQAELAAKLQQEREEVEKKLREEEVELQQKSEAMKEAMKLAEAEQAELAAKLQQEREEVERKLREEESAKQVLLEEQARFQAEQLNLRAELAMLRNGLQEKDELLNTQVEKLKAEKRKVEESLTESLNKKLKEKDDEYEANLRRQQEVLRQQQEALSQQLQAKEREQGSLQDELKKMQTEKKQVQDNMEDVLESELVCSICSELFIQSISLQCSHSFCQLCIETWMRQKKECPNCRTRITSKVRSIVLDNYIDKIVNFLSNELKQTRLALVAERKEQWKKFESAKVPAPAPALAGRTTVIDLTQGVASPATVNMLQQYRLPAAQVIRVARASAPSGGATAAGIVRVAAPTGVATAAGGVRVAAPTGGARATTSTSTARPATNTQNRQNQGQNNRQNQGQNRQNQGQNNRQNHGQNRQNQGQNNRQNQGQNNRQNQGQNNRQNQGQNNRQNQGQNNRQDQRQNNRQDQRQNNRQNQRQNNRQNQGQTGQNSTHNRINPAPAPAPAPVPVPAQQRNPFIVTTAANTTNHYAYYGAEGVYTASHFHRR